MAGMMLFLIFSGPACDGAKGKKDMVLVTAGEFTMGSDTGEEDEKPAHKVYLDDYYIDKYEVTVSRYAAFLNAYGSDTIKSGEFAGESMIKNYDGFMQKKGGKWQPVSGMDNNPVTNVTWYGANEYALFYGKRLPTEAEWEKAARGGKNGSGYIFSGGNNPDEVGWLTGNSANGAHPVGLKQANELGLFDMTGNVWEWCSDWFAHGYYSGSPAENPPGPENGAGRVIRGGSWDVVDDVCRTTGRYWDYPENWSGGYGFRCVSDNK